MSKTAQRLIIFFTGIPIVLFFVLFDAYTHLMLHLLIILVSLCAASETHRLVKRKSAQKELPLIILPVLLPITAALCAVLKLPFALIDSILVLDFTLIFCVEIFSQKHRAFSSSIEHIASSLFIVFYGGYLLTYISKMTIWTDSSLYIAAFLIITFLCDSAAWFFGVLFGKNNRGIFRVSPNKSLAGALGGLLVSIATALLICRLFPNFCGGSYLMAGVLGGLIAVAAIIGDLAESVIKRSSGSKDSGSLILGRGGILDSIDSILFAAPVYYTALTFHTGNIVI